MGINRNDFKKLSPEEKANLSEVELIEYFEKLRDLYLELPYNSSEIVKQEVFYRITAAMLNPLFWAVFNPTLINKNLLPSKDGYIYVSNHLTYLDHFLIVNLVGNRPIHFMASNEFLSMKRGFIYKAWGSIFVDRNSEESKTKARELQTQLVVRGKNIAIFPEGTRKPPYDTLKGFKIGAAKIAQDSGRGIVPLAINNNWKRNGLIARVCSDPIFVSEKADLLEVTDNLWNIVNNGIKENENSGTAIQKILRR